MQKLTDEYCARLKYCGPGGNTVLLYIVLRQIDDMQTEIHKHPYMINCL